LITVVWVLFAILFLRLGLYYRAEAKRQIPSFPVPDRLAGTGVSIRIMGTDLDQPVQEFVVQFNKYIDERNAETRRLNTNNSRGNFLAAITALFSAVIASLG
jgi:hypothetical protein